MGLLLYINTYNVSYVTSSFVIELFEKLYPGVISHIKVFNVK